MTAITADPEIKTVETPIETIKPMKLSEAMRLGSITTTQARGAWSAPGDSPEDDPKMCAMSTAWYALTGHDGNDASGSALEDLLSKHLVSHPVDSYPVTVRSTIIDLNDRHKWTRLQIADWLSGIGL